MKSNHYIVLYFQVHQPRRLKLINEPGNAGEPHFDDDLNKAIIQRIASDCYLPANSLLLKLINQYPQIRITFSLSGLFMEQLEAYAPEALKSFKLLADTGSVEFLAETYYHSLASLVKGDEFESQVQHHAKKTHELFGMKPLVFRNTQLIYNDEIGKRVSLMGFQGVFTEGHESTLLGRSQHEIYAHPDCSELQILLRNYRLSDDIAFRFLENGVRLEINQYMAWLNGMPATEKTITLALNYETFGEHYKKDTGILDFLSDLLKSLSVSDKFCMVTPSEVIRNSQPENSLSIEQPISWSDAERDVSAWLGNEWQKDAFNSMMALESDIKGLKEERLLQYWRTLQASDHFYYMSLKTGADGSVYSHFNPYASAKEAYNNYVDVIKHLVFKIDEEKSKSNISEHDISFSEAERQMEKTTTPVWVMNLEAVPQGMPQ